MGDPAFPFDMIPIAGGGGMSDVTADARYLQLTGGTVTGGLTLTTGPLIVQDQVQFHFGDSADYVWAFDTLETVDKIKNGYTAGLPSFVGIRSSLYATDYFGPGTEPGAGAVVSVMDGAVAGDDEYIQMYVDGANAYLKSLASVPLEIDSVNSTLWLTDTSGKFLDTASTRVKLFRKLDMGGSVIGSISYLQFGTHAAAPANSSLWINSGDGKIYWTDSVGADHALY